MLLQKWVGDHIVFGVWEYIGPFRGDRSKFDTKRKFGFIKMFERVAISARSVPILPAA